MIIEVGMQVTSDLLAIELFLTSPQDFGTVFQMIYETL